MTAALFILNGCATTKPPTYVRADGKTSTPQQYELDKTVCNGEAQKANAMGSNNVEASLYGLAVLQERKAALNDVLKGCMAARGYLQVPEPD